MRRASVLLLLVAGLLAAQKEIRIPFEHTGGGAIWLRVRVNGSEPEHFLFDSGAGGAVVNRNRVGALGLKVMFERMQPNAGAGDNPTPIGFLPAVSYQLGPGVVLRPGGSAAIDLEDIASRYGAAMDGIIGGEILMRYTAALDYDAKTFTFYEPRTFQYKGNGVSLPVEVRQNHSFVRCAVSIGGEPPVEGTFMIDSPFSDVVMFTEPFAREHGLASRARKLLPYRGGGVGGRFPDRRGRIASLRIGPFAIASPVAHFPEAKAGAFARTDIAGILGSELLRRFRVILDYSRSRVILEPNQHLGEPCPADASGMQLRTAAPAYREFFVDSLVPGTPAAEAGLAAGDQITAIDGGPASALTLQEIGRMLRNPGRTVSLETRRGSEKRVVTLALRELL